MIFPFASQTGISASGSTSSLRWLLSGPPPYTFLLQPLQVLLRRTELVIQRSPSFFSNAVFIACHSPGTIYWFCPFLWVVLCFYFLNASSPVRRRVHIASQPLCKWLLLIQVQVLSPAAGKVGKLLYRGDILALLTDLSSGTFNTAASAAWPPQLCKWVAETIVAAFLKNSAQERGLEDGGKEDVRQGDGPAKRKYPEKECLRVMKGAKGCALNAALLEDLRDIVEKFVKESKVETGGGKATIQRRAGKKLLGGGWFLGQAKTGFPSGCDYWRHINRTPESLERLELLATLIAVKMWGQGREKNLNVKVEAFTDNKGNSFALKKAMSTEFPLTLLVMELARTKGQRTSRMKSLASSTWTRGSIWEEKASNGKSWRN